MSTSLPLSSSTEYFTVPVPTMLWVPKPSTSPVVSSYVMKSFLSDVKVRQQPVSNMASMTSESNAILPDVD